MIGLCIALLVIGLLLLVTEMFMAGFGVCGIGGIFLLTVSAILAVLYVPYGWFFVSAELAVLAAVVYGLYMYIKKRQLHGKLFMTETLNEDTPPLSGGETFIGKEGVSKTTMRPVGEVDFNGSSVEAISEGHYLGKGVRVKVTDVRDSKIIVRAVQG
jgi:membrane-bound serine protease (ClpP class)